jgi:hypothetical protein
VKGRCELSSLSSQQQPSLTHRVSRYRWSAACQLTLDCRCDVGCFELPTSTDDTCPLKLNGPSYSRVAPLSASYLSSHTGGRCRSRGALILAVARFAVTTFYDHRMGMENGKFPACDCLPEFTLAYQSSHTPPGLVHVYIEAKDRRSSVVGSK